MRLHVSWLVVIAGLSSSACTFRRTIAIGKESRVEQAPAGAVMPSWRVAPLNVHYEILAQTGAPALNVPDVPLLEQQVGDRLQATLVQQAPLGYREHAADYVLELEVTGRETASIGRQFGLGLGLQLGLSFLGMGAGAAIGAATTTNTSNSGWYPGFMIGTGVGLASGVTAALLTESSAVAGKFEAHVILRRIKDRVPVAERTVRSQWRRDVSMIGAEQKVAAGSGEGLVEFEKVLLVAIRELCLEVVETPPATP